MKNKKNYMSGRFLKYVWKPFAMVAVLFVYSNTAFAFDDIETMRRNMSKGDVITNTDSIDFLFGIDRQKQVYNPKRRTDCIFYDTTYFYKTQSPRFLITKDSLETIVVPSTIEIDGDTFTVEEFYIAEPGFDWNNPNQVVSFSHPNYEHPFVKLKSIVIPNTVWEIEGLHDLMYLETVVIEQNPDSCYYVDYDNFFANCPNLKSIRLPEGIDELPRASFYGCSSLREIVLPQSLEEIECACFVGCTQLEEICIPKNVRIIDENSFMDCPNLKQIILPQALEEISKNCFKGCTRLEKVYIPANVRYIDSTAFMDCPNIKEIIIDSENKYYDSRDNCNAIIDSRTNTLIRACNTSTIPDGVTTICDLAFANSSIRELHIPASVDSIGLAICAGCRCLEKITVDKRNKKYDSRKGCNAIIRTADNTLITASNSAYIPNGVEAIGECAFINSGITGIYIPQSVRQIGSQAFAACTSLSQITVDKRNKVYRSENNCLIKDKTLVAGCSKSVIPSDITTIGPMAFRLIPLYWKLDIPDNITEIQLGAFSECNTLECLTLPDSLSLLGDYAFYDCNNLTSVVINSVDKFGWCAFYLCRKLNNVSFTSPIDSLGSVAFSNCLDLKAIALPQGMTYIGNFAFYHCPSLESVKFPSTLETVDDYAFGECQSLESLYLPTNLKSMGNESFYYCSSLTELDLPESLIPKSIWDNVFTGCKNLETITLPFTNFQNGVYTNVFRGCTRLNMVILK